MHKRPVQSSRLPTALRLVAAGVLTVGCARTVALAPPPTRLSVVIDTIHGVPVEDRYRWLEQQDSPEVRAWVDAQNAHTARVLGADNPARLQLRQRLRALLDVPIASPARRAGVWEYFTLRRSGEEVAAIYRRPAADVMRPVDLDGRYDLVLSPLAIRSDGTTSVAIEAISPDNRLLLYSVRDGGPDETTLKVRDLERGADLPDSLPWALYASPSFAPDSRGFYYVHRSRAVGPRVKLHLLGTPLASDSTLFGDGLPSTHFLTVNFAAGGRFRIYSIAHGWARSEVIVDDTRTGSRIDLTQGTDAHWAAQVVDGELWLRTDHQAPRGRVVAMSLDSLAPGRWREVIAQGDDVLDTFTPIEGKVYVTYLKNASHRLAVLSRDGRPLGEVPVPALSTVSIRGGGPGVGLLSVASFGQPNTIYRVELATGARSVWEAPRVPFDTASFDVSQHWATSRDGTRVPMFIVQRRAHARNPDTPALLTGYGGFTLSLTPRFDARASLWAERGGIFVQATLRGGNEFGEEWHKGGMLGNKQHVFDDFLAVAQFLVDSGFTSAPRFAIRGVSNAGLLMGAALTQRPDLFGAAFVGLPDLDIARFPWFVSHHNAPALLEYGDARRADQFPAILNFSPYQNVRDGVRYPAVMVQTGLNDTRVAPWQARRFAARLQAATTSGRPVIFMQDARSGHAGGRSMTGTIDLATQEMEFLLRMLKQIP